MPSSRRVPFAGCLCLGPRQTPVQTLPCLSAQGSGSVAQQSLHTPHPRESSPGPGPLQVKSGQVAAAPPGQGPEAPGCHTCWAQSASQ